MATEHPPVPLVLPGRPIAARSGLTWLHALLHASWREWPLLLVLVVPPILMRDFWSAVIGAGWPRALDGSGHYALARIYAERIFPDTFGWTGGFFTGMPFPNFYPPLFYWTIGLLDRVGLLSSLTALDLLVGLPLLLLPAGVWRLAGTVTGGSRPVMHTAAALSVAPLMMPFFHGVHGTGLNYHDTFAVGLYTQPLGFFLLLIWYAAFYPRRPFTAARVAGTGALFALVLLANFFIALMAGILAGLLGLCVLWRAARGDAEAIRELLARGGALLLGAALAAFWLVPMLSTYDYFVTRPLVEVSLYPTPLMQGWYVLTCGGLLLWLCRASRPVPYLVTCVGLVTTLVSASAVAPSWFPLQAFRCVPIVTFFTAVPVAVLLVAMVTAARDLASRLVARLPSRVRARRIRRSPGRSATLAAVATIVVVLLLAGLATTRLTARLFNAYLLGLSFYVDPGGAEVRLDPAAAQGWVTRHKRFGQPVIGGAAIGFGNAEGGAALRELRAFVRANRHSRYLVELPDGMDPHFRVFDSRAMTSYIAAEGGEALGAAFREASPSSLFVNPLVNALSADVDAFGLSSMLADDVAFEEQPLETHVRRAEALGVRYLVMFTPSIRARLEQLPGVRLRQPCGVWAIYELAGARPFVEALRYRPAAVIGDITLKARLRNDYGFIRLAEEQFADGWRDVLLVRSPVSEIDRVPDLEQFGALIVTTYDCHDCELAYRRLTMFGATRPLVLVRAPGQLFRRMLLERERFPLLRVVDMEGDAGEPLRTFGAPTTRYESSHIRRAWREIRALLDAHKMPVRDVRADVSRGPNALRIDVRDASPDGAGDLKGAAIPILIRQTYHPRWTRDDGRALFPAMPFHTVTFAERSVDMHFARTATERWALALSAMSLLATVGVLLIAAVQPRVSRARTP